MNDRLVASIKRKPEAFNRFGFFHLLLRFIEEDLPQKNRNFEDLSSHETLLFFILDRSEAE